MTQFTIETPLESCPICHSHNLDVKQRPSIYFGKVEMVECKDCWCGAPLDKWNNGRDTAWQQPKKPAVFSHA